MTARRKPQIRKHAHARPEGGFVLVMVAISALALCAMVGFAVDLGSWYLNASRLQRAADASALAGADALPDIPQAKLDAITGYARNGYVHGDDYDISTFTTDERFSTSIQAKHVKTYFIGMIVKELTITRTANASRAHATPLLGSPFNVMGSGNLDIPGIPKQYYWLAVNGICSAREDGDYFTARWDGNKWPLKSTVNANFSFETITDGSAGGPSKHHCPWEAGNPDKDFVQENPEWDKGGKNGYSYFIDVPPPPAIGESVNISLYDAGYSIYDGPTTRDVNNKLPGDINPFVCLVFHVYDTAGTPDIDTDDGAALRSKIICGDEYMLRWSTLYTLDYDRIKDGGQFRVQVYPDYNDYEDLKARIGGNTFSIGAFPSWKAPLSGCSKLPPNPDRTCPQVYGRNAVSVYNDLEAAASAGKATFYFAEMGTAHIGRPFYLFLWDPGEGVSELKLLAPDGTPLNFEWSASPRGAVWQGSGTSLNTSGTDDPPGATAANPTGNRSNRNRFNDRLVTLKVTLPPSYATMIGPGGDKWIRMQYTLDRSRGDRTTWGASVGDGANGPPRLTR